MTNYRKAVEGLSKRFYSRIAYNPSTGCTEWQKYRNKDGYGTLYFKNREQKAHRVAWFLEYGEWPPNGLFVCHKCDNPPCVTISHLFLGTPLDNTLDMIAKGRKAPPRIVEECKWGHKYTPENTYIIPSSGAKVCFICKRERDRVRWNKNLED